MMHDLVKYIHTPRKMFLCLPFCNVFATFLVSCLGHQYYSKIPSLG